MSPSHGCSSVCLCVCLCVCLSVCAGLGVQPLYVHYVDDRIPSEIGAVTLVAGFLPIFFVLGVYSLCRMCLEGSSRDLGAWVYVDFGWMSGEAGMACLGFIIVVGIAAAVVHLFLAPMKKLYDDTR